MYIYISKRDRSAWKKIYTHTIQNMIEKYKTFIKTKNQSLTSKDCEKPQKRPYRALEANPIWRIGGVHLSRNNNEKPRVWHPGILEDVAGVIGSDISGILQEAARVPVEWRTQVMAYIGSVFSSLPGREFGCQRGLLNGDFAIYSGYSSQRGLLNGVFAIHSSYSSVRWINLCSVNIGHSKFAEENKVAVKKK